MDAPHLHVGSHPEHGIVATPTPRLPAHLAHWHLIREQFQPVPGTRLYRLTDSNDDGRRRARQAVADLRSHGLTIHADLALDPEQTPDTPHRAADSPNLTAITAAARARSPQRPALTAIRGGTAASTRPTPPPAPAPRPRR